MGRIVIELTDRCNLRCGHCFSGRHGGRTDLSLAVLERILAEAKHLGFDELNFTGGDPTVHPRFLEVLERTRAAGYAYGFVTNGWNFATVFPALRPMFDRLRGVTFSMDGATEATHDRLRGRGSYRRLMQAMSLAVVEDLPFSINMVVTAHNRHEVGEAVRRAARLGARGLRFGHLMPAPGTATRGLDLSPEERKAVEAEIRELARDAPLPVAMAPGHHTEEPFPCAPLQGEEINVDCRGWLTKCCHLSGHGAGVGTGDVYADLSQTTLAEALRRLVEDNLALRREKARRWREGAAGDVDRFPCWYCSLHYRKVDWLKRLAGHPWAALVP